MNALLLPVILMVVSCPLLPIAAEKPVFTDQFVLHHSGGPEQARQFAEERGFVYLDRVSGGSRSTRSPLTDLSRLRLSETTITCVTTPSPNDLSFLTMTTR